MASFKSLGDILLSIIEPQLIYSLGEHQMTSLIVTLLKRAFWP